MRKGFTLVEVMITLGVIGVVAAVTLPVLNQKIKEARTVNRLKQVYSTLSQAYTRAVQEHGTPDNWELIGYNSPEGSNNLMAKLTPYLKVIQVCNAGETGCFQEDVSYVGLNGKYNAGKYFSASTKASIARLVNGAFIRTFIYSPNCTTNFGTSTQLQNGCGQISIDINGFAGPNQYGVDTFWVYVTKYGLVPFGSAVDTSGFKFSSNCKDKSIGFVGSWSVNGMGCAAWVLYNENMDYLHCKDLSWTGKKRCK